MHFCATMSAILHIFFILLWDFSSVPEGNVAHGTSLEKSFHQVNKQGKSQLADNQSLLIWEVQEDLDDENQDPSWTLIRSRFSQKTYGFFKHDNASKKFLSTIIVGPSLYTRFCNYRI